MPLVLEDWADCASQDRDPLSELEARRLVQSINVFLYGLPEEKRRIFLLRYWYLESLAQIASQTGLRGAKIINGNIIDVIISEHVYLQIVLAFLYLSVKIKTGIA